MGKQKSALELFTQAKSDATSYDQYGNLTRRNRIESERAAAEKAEEFRQMNVELRKSRNNATPGGRLFEAANSIGELVSPIPLSQEEVLMMGGIGAGLKVAGKGVTALGKLIKEAPELYGGYSSLFDHATGRTVRSAAREMGEHNRFPELFNRPASDLSGVVLQEGKAGAMTMSGRHRPQWGDRNGPQRDIARDSYDGVMRDRTLEFTSEVNNPLNNLGKGTERFVGSETDVPFSWGRQNGGSWEAIPVGNNLATTSYVHFRKSPVPMLDFDKASGHVSASADQITIGEVGGLDEVRNMVKPLADRGHFLRIDETPGGYHVFDMTDRRSAKEFIQDLPPSVKQDPYYQQYSANENKFWYRTSAKEWRENDYVSKNVDYMGNPANAKVRSALELAINHDLAIWVNKNQDKVKDVVGRFGISTEQAGEFLQKLSVRGVPIPNFIEGALNAGKEYFEDYRRFAGKERNIDNLISWAEKNDKYVNASTYINIEGKKVPTMISHYPNSKYSEIRLLPEKKWGMSAFSDLGNSAAFGYSAQRGVDNSFEIGHLGLFANNQKLSKSTLANWDNYLPSDHFLNNMMNSFSGDSAPIVAHLLKSGKYKAEGLPFKMELNDLGKNTLLSQAMKKVARSRDPKDFFEVMNKWNDKFPDLRMSLDPRDTKSVTVEFPDIMRKVK